MKKFLIDVNLPKRFSLWKSASYIHQSDLDDTASDNTIWDYAKEKNLTIVTKDSDFSNRILFANPPPKIIHVKVGNMRIQKLHEYLNSVWPQALELIETHKLVNIYPDKIEALR
ncbi:DUF5615 family PIN-like protein [Allomuricauda sp. d1]|uniref:DUF5615 family PIN-like protein n=1 Tax=Allomuricauda sp. d1 TaxID=3136725 RepID=UPI0031E1FCCC